MQGKLALENQTDSSQLYFNSKKKMSEKEQNDAMEDVGKDQMEDADSSSNQVPVPVYPVDYAPNKRKLKDGTTQKYPAKEGETTEEWKLRRKREAVARHRKKMKELQESRKKSGEVAIKAAEAKWTAEQMNHDDPFILKVAGQHNFDFANHHKKYRECGKAVKMRICIAQMMKNINIERKGQPTMIDLPEWEIGFHIDPDRNVGDPGTITKKVTELPIVAWLRVKKSTIEAAGLGLFADRDFQEGQIVGMYLGGKEGMENYSIAPGWPGGEIVHCFPLSHYKAMRDRSTRTMGIQMINDPNHGLELNAQPSEMWNVEFRSDLFVVALKKINKGDEIFADYRIGWKDEDIEEENDGGGKMPAKQTA